MPRETVDTRPDEPIVTTPVLLLLHVPPPVASVRLVVSPEHTEWEPVISENGFTLTNVVAIQPVGSV